LSQRDVMTQPLEQIVRRKLSDEVFDRLERMITRASFSLATKCHLNAC